MTRGGKREGAGRTAGTTKPDKKIQICMRFSRVVLKWLRSHKNYNGMVEKLIRKEMDKEKGGGFWS